MSGESNGGASNAPTEIIDLESEDDNKFEPDSTTNQEI